jgi:hypothetical protein
MPIASGSARRTAYVAEATLGVTPATPSLKNLRVTGGSLRTNKTTVVSDEIQLDRNVRDEPQTGQDVAGTYNFEFSYGTFDDMLEGALFGTWTTNVLKNGITPKSFTFEETVDLGGGVSSFSRFTGTMVNTFNLALASRALTTGSIDLMAQKEVLASAIVTGATYATANTEPVQNGSTGVAALGLTGLTTQPKVRSLNLSIANNLRTRPLIGSLFTESFGYGRCEVTGSLEAYFETNELYQKVLDHGSAPLTFNVGETANKKYTVLLPKIIFTNGERRPSSNNDDVMVTIPFRAVYDLTELCSIKITRAVA